MGSGARKAASRPGSTTTRPSGFSRSEATFARNLLGATPTDAVRATSTRMRVLMSRAMVGPSPRSARLAVTSRNASSMDTGSSSGVHSASRAMIWRDTAAYLSMSTGRYTASRHRRYARLIGMAEWMPKRRASDEGAADPPRPAGHCAPHDGPAPQLGAIALLHRRVERVHVHVEHGPDRGRGSGHGA